MGLQSPLLNTGLSHRIEGGLCVHSCDSSMLGMLNVSAGAITSDALHV